MKTLNAGSLPTFEISTADLAQLTEWYNANSGSTKDVKFPDIETAREKSQELLTAIKELGSSEPIKKVTPKAAKKATKKAATKKGDKKEGKKAATKKEAKPASKKGGKSKAPANGEPSKPRGRASAIAGKFIYRKIDPETKKPFTNPRREDSLGYHAWNAVKEGMTYEEYVATGHDGKHLKWDIEHGYVVMEDKKRSK